MRQRGGQRQPQEERYGKQRQLFPQCLKREILEDIHSKPPRFASSEVSTRGRC